MYPVTQDFLDKIKAEKRQVSAKAEISYTDPFIDQSINIAVSEKANVSYEQQTADAVDTMPYKWASLDGSWKLDGSYHLAPAPELLSQYQFGWWGSQLSGADGSFVNPYPTLTVTHFARPIHTLTVVGDSARGEYPVDFQIDLYASDNTLLYSKAVTGNTQINWQFVLPSPILDVTKQVLTITKWSHSGRQVKIVEFFTSIQETYLNDDIVSIRLLEEREASQGSLPVGNITANEVTLTLNNESKKFDVDNTQSPLHNLLKPNRKIKLWLGIEAENLATDKPPTFTRSSIAYLSDGTQVAANQPRFETGVFGKAIMLEEGTTNLITNPANLNLTPWALNKTAIVLENNLWKLVEDSTNGEHLIKQSFTTDSTGSTYSFTVYVKAGTRNKIMLMFSSISYWQNGNGASTKFDLSNGTVISTTATSSGIKYIGNGIYKCWITGTTTHDSFPSNVNIFLVDDNLNTTYQGDGTSYIYVLKTQLEAKPYATSFIDGTRAAETLTIPTAGVLNPQEGTIDFWVKPLVVTNYNNFFSMTTSNGRFLLFFASDRSAHFDYGAWNTGPVTPINTMIANNWYYIVLRWSASTNTQALFVNGVKYEKTLPNGVATSFPSTVSVVNNYSAYIDDLRISNRARTDAEIAAAYASGQPLQKDDSTTYLLPFNGSIYPVEQVWIPLGTFWSLDWDSPDDTLEATVTARDRMELLRKGTYQSSQVQTNVSLYTLAEQVLQDAGLKTTEYSIDTALQSIIVPYAWFNPTSHREALRIIAEAALAVVYADRDGIIRIQSFNSGLGTTAIQITEDEYFLPLRNPSQQSQVANQVIVTTSPLKPADTAQEVYRSNNPISVPAGQTVTVTANYNQPPVIEAVASLDSPPAGVSIVSATYYGWGAKMSIQNTSGSVANVTLIINGKPLTVQNKEMAMAQDDTSITENGVLRYEFPENPLVQTLTQAQNIANTLLASVKDPRRDLEMDWRGNPALLLGDRITVKGQDYHIIRQEIEWAGYLSAKLNGRKAI